MKTVSSSINVSRVILDIEICFGNIFRAKGIYMMLNKNTDAMESKAESDPEHTAQFEKEYVFGKNKDMLRAKFLHIFAHTELSYQKPETWVNCNHFFRTHPGGFDTRLIDGVLNITPIDGGNLGIKVSGKDAESARLFIEYAFHKAEEYTKNPNTTEEHEKVQSGVETGLELSLIHI